MKIVMIGIGEIGYYLAQVLLSEAHEVVLVEKDDAVYRNAQEHLDAKIVKGDGSNALLLEPLIDEKTDLFVAVTDSDAVNIISVLIARKFGAKRAIARIYDPTNLIHPLLTDDPKVSVINAEMIVARDLARLVGNPSAEEVEVFAQGKAEMVKFQIGEEAKVLNQKLSEIKIPSAWIFIARIRGGEFQIVSGETSFQAGDQVILMGDPHKRKEIEALLGLHQEKVKRVILIGFNAISSKLAVTLRSRDIDVRFIEANKEIAERASAEMDGILVFQGDATSDEILEQAGLDESVNVLALSNDDETNILISLLAKEKKVRRVVALAQKPQYKPIIEKIGIDAVVNPRSAMVDEMIRCIHHEDLSGISILEGGMGRMIEFVVKEKTKFVDTALSQLKWPKGILVGAIVRGDQLIIPRGDDRIHIGDHLLIFTTRSALSHVKRLFAN
ncbi:MAG: Trk system potassium transporter TrkA [Candidatus Omnitrophota bacterium]|nr:Trk system potassium transporter TrkA [Candidatus Omnitrophota bacterium]